MVIWIEEWPAKVMISLIEKPCSIHGEVAQVAPAHRHLDLFLQLAETRLRLGVLQDPAPRRGENQIEGVLRAAQFPAAQGGPLHPPPGLATHLAMVEPRLRCLGHCRAVAVGQIGVIGEKQRTS